MTSNGLPEEGDRVVSLDRSRTARGNGTVIATATIERRGKSELRVWIRWDGDGGRSPNRTWLAVSAMGTRWCFAEQEASR